MTGGGRTTATLTPYRAKRMMGTTKAMSDGAASLADETCLCDGMERN